jgi:hypothetical protein
MSDRKQPATAYIDPENDIPMPKWYRTPKGRVLKATEKLHGFRLKLKLMPCEAPPGYQERLEQAKKEREQRRSMLPGMGDSLHSSQPGSKNGLNDAERAELEQLRSAKNQRERDELETLRNQPGEKQIAAAVDSEILSKVTETLDKDDAAQGSEATPRKASPRKAAAKSE